MSDKAPPTQCVVSDVVNSVGAEDFLYARLTRRLIPFLFICYIAAYLDRANVAFAKLQMAPDLGLSNTVYGIGAGIFFVSYFFFEVPSNILLHRFGARRWIARIMLTWGVISVSMMLVKGAWSFYALRFLLGAAEAGFFPGIILYITYWYPGPRRAKIVSLFMLAIPVSNMIGGPLSGWILDRFSGVWGLPGWQWLFISEGIPSIVLGFVTLRYLEDGIRQSTWLAENEKQVLESNLRRDAPEEVKHSLGSAFADRRVWLLSAMGVLFNLGYIGILYWMPTIIKGMGINNNQTIGLVSVIPWLLALVAMILVGGSSDRMRERRWHFAVPVVVGCIGLCGGIYFTDHPVLAMAGLSVGTAGLLACLPVYWCLPSAFLGGVAAAAGLAIINSCGAIAGFSANFVVGWINDLTGSVNAAMYLFAVLGTLGGLMVFIIPGKLANK